MKLIGNIRNLVRSLLIISSSALIIQGCEKQEEMKHVDLRYRVENEYTVAANGADKIIFQVKSSDPWEIFGSDESADWYTITPNTGDDVTTVYDVEISFKENTDLDDRCDTIIIKSDYWIGKRFTITQKGIAFLKAKDAEPIGQEGGEAQIAIETNQKWTAKVTDGEKWAEISEGEKGEGNGNIVLNANFNKGEKRTATVSIYDRHGELAATALCSQNGVILTPAAPENGKFYQISKEEQTITINVESNAQWEVRKDNPSESDWMTLKTEKGENNGEITVELAEHQGAKVREEKLILQSVAEEGVTPVVKVIRIKQACPPQVETTVLNKTYVAGGEKYIGEEGKKLGTYNIYVEEKPVTAELHCFFLYYPTKNFDYAPELRFHVLGQKLELSTKPWNANVNPGRTTIPVTGTDKPFKLTYKLAKVTKKGVDWLHVQWFYNDELKAERSSDGGANGGDSFKIPYVDIENGGHLEIMAQKESVKISKVEWIPEIDWGE